MSLAARVACPEEALAERHLLGMAEMGFAGLSEQWLMRRAGDLHWRLIARAMGQEEAVFSSAGGEPLYAAFCATRLLLDRPELPRLGGRLGLAARLYRVGRSRLGSRVEIHAEGEAVGHVDLVSAFVGRDGAGNRGLVRRAPRVLALPAERSGALERLAARSARVARLARGHAPEGEALRFATCAAVDFNAAGLLYFPSFAAFADRAESAAGLIAPGALRAREVCFLGNVDPGEALDIRLVARREHRLVLISAGDGRPLAVSRSLR